MLNNTIQRKKKLQTHRVQKRQIFRDKWMLILTLLSIWVADREHTSGSGRQLQYARKGPARKKNNRALVTTLSLGEGRGEERCTDLE